MIWFLYCYFAVLGSVLASFADTSWGRIAAHRSLVWPLSQCDVCHSRLAPWELVPIFSFALLGGQCRRCHTRLSYRTLVFEVTGAVVPVLIMLLAGIG